MTGRSARVAEKLSAARTRLVVEKPFLGALLLHLPLEPLSGLRAVATDARALYYDPQYIESLTLRQAQFALAHQALHCALGHFARRGHRLRTRWDLACDYAVNALLLEEGLDAPPGALFDPALKGLSAEEIYPLLAAHPPRRHFDRHFFDGESVAPDRAADGSTAPHRPPVCASGFGRAHERAVPAPTAQVSRLTPDTHRAGEAFIEGTEELARRWQLRVGLAAQQARHAGAFGATWERLLSAAVAPRLPWRALLARFVASRARLDYTFLRPPRRESAALLPRLCSESIELHAAVDTSGSITADELAAFLAEVDALKGQVHARVTLHLCDSALAPGAPWICEPWEPLIVPPTATGGGGTDFRPVFAWLEARAITPDVVLYFTDALGEFPAASPPYPVAWLVKGSAAVPWGERIQLND